MSIYFNLIGYYVQSSECGIPRVPIGVHLEPRSFEHPVATLLHRVPDVAEEAEQVGTGHIQALVDVL